MCLYLVQMHEFVTPLFRLRQRIMSRGWKGVNAARDGGEFNLQIVLVIFSKPLYFALYSVQYNIIVTFTSNDKEYFVLFASSFYDIFY